MSEAIYLPFKILLSYIYMYMDCFFFLFPNLNPETVAVRTYKHWHKVKKNVSPRFSANIVQLTHNSPYYGEMKKRDII